MAKRRERTNLAAPPIELLLAVFCAFTLLGGCDRSEVATSASAPGGKATTATAPAPPSFVGSAVCAPCHPAEMERWRGSHHDLALQPATQTSVLGRFDGVSKTHFDVTTTFSRRDGRFVVRMEGPDGAVTEFDVTQTFGVDPLQQYLVPFPGGRRQALPWAWDSRPATEGGQRWIHLQPEERIAPGDPLHWTSVAGNWNHQCAECHSTQVRKGFDAASGTYATTFTEPNVGCEACHGPASRHLAWAEARGKVGGKGADPLLGLVFRIGAGDGGTWVRSPHERIAHRSVRRTSSAEIETCARCHSRRSTLREDYVHGRPIVDTHLVALLDQDLYFADGQIRDEVYEYGSFLQSRMYAAGVTCSDCHDPHSLRLREEGNALCGRCHAPEVFDSVEHHHHAPGSAGARCVSCHAPTRTYMVVDARHDHSFRIPRPALSAEIGAPDACTACHANRSQQWAAAAIARWHGARAEPPAHFGTALHAGRSGAAGAEQQLATLVQDDTQPAIARATALRLLGEYLTPASLPALRAGVAAADPLLRLAAAGAAGAIPPADRVGLLSPLLRDPVFSVRTEAALALAEVPAPLWSPADRVLLADVLAEHRAALATNLDQPQAHVGLGNLHAMLGEADAAKAEFEKAIALAPWAIPAYVNLADVQRTQGREQEAEATLRRALASDPRSADVLHALGLALVRQKRMPEAVDALGRAAALAPDRARYAVAYALALEETGEQTRARAVLDAALARRPGDPVLAPFRVGSGGRVR